MIVRKFIDKFVKKNTLIRLHHEIEGGHRMIQKPKMEWIVKNGKYTNHKVIGVTDILFHDHYPEAVNLVIENRI